MKTRHSNSTITTAIFFPGRVVQRVGLAALALAVVVAIIPVAAIAAEGSLRDETIEQLRSLESAWPAQGVRVSIPASKGAPLRIGEDLSYAFESGTSGYLTAVHVDTHGMATLLYPRANVEAGRIGADRSVHLPAPSDPFTLQVQPPIGRDFVYAIVTEKPISRQDLGIVNGDIVVSYEPQDSAAFVRRLRSALESQTPGSIRVTHVVQQVDGRGEVQYDKGDILEFFAQRTRSIRPPKLDLQIQFSSGSAQLDDQARQNVDEFAGALTDPSLSGLRFKVSGHTDDVGAPSLNLSLSKRRAEAVRDYLVKTKGIDSSRLVIEAHGENSLLLTEDSEYARQMNRRVEFAPAR